MLRKDIGVIVGNLRRNKRYLIKYTFYIDLIIYLK